MSEKTKSLQERSWDSSKTTPARHSGKISGPDWIRDPGDHCHHPLAASCPTQNMLNVIRQISICGVLAIGQTFVILTGGIDFGRIPPWPWWWC